MRRTEDHHHTREQIEGYLQVALEIAEAAGLDDSERAALLPTLVQLVSAKQVFYEQVQSIPNLAIPRDGRRL